MTMLELRLRTAGAQDLATVKVKVTGPRDAYGFADLTCVQTSSDGKKQTIVFSDETSEEAAA